MIPLLKTEKYLEQIWSSLEQNMLLQTIAAPIGKRGFEQNSKTPLLFWSRRSPLSPTGAASPEWSNTTYLRT